MKKAVICTMLLTAGVAAWCFGQIPAVIAVTHKQLVDECGTSNVKLVFIWNRSMYYVDFTENAPSIRKIAAVTDAAIPVISPDGNWVTYATQTTQDGATLSPSTAWVCRLAHDGQPMQVSQSDNGFVPRFMRSRLDTPTVIYSTAGYHLDNKSYAWDGAGIVAAKKIIDGAVESGETVVFNGGSYFGGISYDERYLGSAENNAYAHILDLQDQSKVPYEVHSFQVRSSATGQMLQHTVQTCNASMSSSRIITDAIMYVDFGLMYAQCQCTSAIGPWDFHTRLFISKSDATILRYYDIPSAPQTADTATAGNGEIIGREWSYPEWSNHPYFAVTSILNRRRYLDPAISFLIPVERRERITLINLKDSSYTDLIQSTDTTAFDSDASFIFPGLWIEVPSDFIEEPGWLGRSNHINQPVVSKGICTINIQGRTVSAASGLKRVSVFSSNGRLITGLQRSGGHLFMLPQSGASGIVVISAEAFDGSTIIRKHVLP
ncbi:MAG: hypothetical protein GF401_09870 [Chitinivibrionales bacterium]|nr:hypothetical protein [Chitinivibrionales bacterium]